MRGPRKVAAESAARSAERSGGLGLRDPTLFGLWLLVLLPPFIFLPGLDDNFRLPKLLLSELLGLLSLLLLSLRLWRRPALDLRALVRAPAVRIVGPILLAGSLGLFFGDHPEVIRRALPSLWIGGLCLVGWSLALGERERSLLLRATMVPAFLLAALAVLQFHDLYDPFAFRDRVTDRIGLTSLAGGAFDLSGYLVLPLLLAQAAWRRLAGDPGGRRLRWLLVAFLLVAGWAMVAARTVTALLALAVGSYVLWRRALPLRRQLAAAGVAAAAAAVLVTVGPLGERASKMASSLQAGEINRLLTGRLDAWRGAAWMVEQHPLIGVGHGAFRAEYGPARLALTERGVKFFPNQKQVFFTNAHSDVLDAVAEWGAVGALAMGISTLFFVAALRRRWRRPTAPAGGDPAAYPADETPTTRGDPPSAQRRDLELAALLALLVLCSTYFPLHLGLLSYPWLLFLSGPMAPPRAGIRGAVEGGAEDGVETPAEASAVLGHGPSRAPAKLAAALLTVLFAVALWQRFGAARDLLGASRLVALTEASVLQLARGGQVPPALVQRNLGLLRRAAELDPAEVGVPISEGGHYFLMQRYDAALRAYARAAELEMRGEIYANIARVHLVTERRPEAMAAIRKAITLDHTQRRVFGDVMKEERRRQRAVRERRR